MARLQLVVLVCCLVAAFAAPAEEVSPDISVTTERLDAVTPEIAESRLGFIRGGSDSIRNIFQSGAKAIDDGTHKAVQTGFNFAQAGVQFANEVANMSLAPIRVFRRRNNGTPLPSIPQEIGQQMEIAKNLQVTSTKYPFVVSIWFENAYLCGGVLIDETHIITVAKCFDGVKLRAKKIFIQTADSQRIRAEKIIIHPCYDRTAEEIYYDIAILLLENEIEYSGKVNHGILPTFSYNAESSTTGTAVTLNPALTQDDVSIVDLGDCSDYYDISTYQICAQKANGKSGCVGALGMPLIKYKNGKPIVSGLASYASSNCHEEPTVFTRLSSFNYWTTKTVEGVKPSDITCNI